MCRAHLVWGLRYITEDYEVRLFVCCAIRSAKNYKENQTETKIRNDEKNKEPLKLFFFFCLFFFNYMAANISIPFFSQSFEENMRND